jgi:tetratricopeptide (TPR) repeat protein
LLRINSLLAVQEPSESEQQQFQNAFINGVNAGQQATVLDPSEPNNWGTLGNLYSILVSINIEGSYERSKEALTRARDLDPKNPLRYLALAQLEARAGNVDEARSAAAEAIRLKPNYSDAFFFLSQLDITTGNVQGAIESTRAMINLEPQNPARHYQLGVLLSADNDIEGAVTAFERAVALNPDYANARYFLALGYDALGRSQDARVQLERVLALNPGNRDVIDLIATIDTRGSLNQQQLGQEEQPVSSETQVTEEDEAVTTTEDPNSTLVTPVNAVPLQTDEEGLEMEEGIEADTAE